jgi:hypothetical protein
MRSYILLAVAVAIVFGGIWFVSANPNAKAQLRTQANSVEMDIDAMTRKAKNLPVTVVENFM